MVVELLDVVLETTGVGMGVVVVDDEVVVSGGGVNTGVVVLSVVGGSFGVVGLGVGVSTAGIDVVELEPDIVTLL